MNGRLLRYPVITVLALLFSLASWASRAEGGHKIVDGLSVYVGVLPAAIMLGYPKSSHEREMHGGAPGSSSDYHFVVALFDAASGKRITDAQVKIGGASIGMGFSREKAEPMLVNKVLTYGNYVSMPGPGPYKIQIEVRRPGINKLVEVEFDYPFPISNPERP